MFANVCPAGTPNSGAVEVMHMEENVHMIFE